jgi:signal transduction histidine kinase
MKFGIRWRLTWFGTAIVLVALAIAWTARTTWDEARELNERISKVQVESFNIADHFQASIIELNTKLHRFQSTRDASEWQDWVRESKALDEWIDEQSKLLTNPNEGRVLDRINNAYDIFREDARGLTNAVALRESSASSELLERAETQVKDLLGLGNQLANAHRKNVDDLIARTQKSLPQLEKVIFGLLLVLLGLGAWVAGVVYREMIAPLRLTLSETRASMERQEKLASLGVLAAGVAHEVRNPLTAIKARLFTQQKKLTPGSPEAEDAAVINNEINRLERIVKDFLQFARPAEPRLVRVLAESPLREVRELMAPEMAKNGILVTVDSVVRAEIEIDLQQFKQVLINLVQNAAESIERHGTITLRARLVTGRLRGPGASAVVLEVQDNGKGISPEVQKRLFDPFFTTKDTGTGLGLSIAARIVEKHGGVLEFQTAPNRGTIFGIVLPRCPADEITR